MRKLFLSSFFISFRELVLQMQVRARQIGQFQYGFAIFDDKGKQIGIW